MKREDIEFLNEIGYRKFCETPWLWHELELISDGKELINNCVLCHQPGLGPTYKCKRIDCEFILHEACARRPHPHPQEMKPMVDLIYVQCHMMLIKEVEMEMENNEKIVVCSLCDDPISGLGSAYYKCLTPNFTNFRLHQSCAHVLLVIKGKKHPAHRDCKDDLYLSVVDGHCGLCGKICNIYYYCYGCRTGIDIKCALLCLLRAENCNPHKFGTKLKDVGQLPCQACGRQTDETLFICRNCYLFIHKRCVERYLHPIKTKGCDHLLSCMFSLSSGKISCRFCEGLVDERYPAYICDICHYVAHLWCAYKFMDSNDIAQLVDKTRSLQVIENHFSHPQHNLFLNNKQPQHGQRCMGCMDHIFSPPFYNCMECSFFLHERCAKLPLKFESPLFTELTIMLLPRLSFKDQMCTFCKRTFTGFVCFWGEKEKAHDEMSNFDLVLDIQCSLLGRDLPHKGHQHSLFFETLDKGKCNACNEALGHYFRCGFCNFNLCVKCVTYPFQIWHKDDEHPLNLTDKIEDNSEEYYYLICEQKRNSFQWFYYCSLCNYAAHLDCAYSRKI